MGIHRLLYFLVAFWTQTLL